NASDTELAALADLQAAYSRLTDYPGRVKTAEQAVQNANETATTAQKKSAECVENIALDAGEVMGVLEAASVYLHMHPAPAACPLCESAEKVQDLSQRVTQRLGSVSTLQEAQAEKRAADTAVQR